MPWFQVEYLETVTKCYVLQASSANEAEHFANTLYDNNEPAHNVITEYEETAVHQISAPFLATPTLDLRPKLSRKEEGS